MFIKATNSPLPMMPPTGQLVKDYVEQVSGARSVNIQTWNDDSQCFEERLDHTLTSFGDRLEGLAQQMNFMQRGGMAQLVCKVAGNKMTEEMIVDLYNLSLQNLDF
jgi:hypothetical protein